MSLASKPLPGLLGPCAACASRPESSLDVFRRGRLGIGSKLELVTGAGRLRKVLVTRT